MENCAYLYVHYSFIIQFKFQQLPFCLPGTSTGVIGFEIRLYYTTDMCKA